MTNPAETFAREALASWEKQASGYAEQMNRDARVLAAGADLLRVGLLWKKAVDDMTAQVVSQWMAPFMGAQR